jgi:murein L,D-transpeptidase YcbB/YkuD
VLIGDGVPIYILYLTARPDGDAIAFADDVYGLDGDGEKGKVVASAAAKK